MTRTPYPTARRSAKVDEYHGVQVPDPYDWLEDADSPETREWVTRQNEVTFSFLAGLPSRDWFRERLTALWDYPKYGVPFRRGGKFFRFQNTGLQNQDVLFGAPSLNGPWRVLLDPNTLSAEGTVALGSVNVSHDGRYAAYSLRSGGSDWLEWRVREVSSAEDLPDVLRWSKFSEASWLPDASGFYYACYDAPAAGETYSAVNRARRTMLHRLGTSQAEDRVVLEFPDHPDWLHYSRLSEDGLYLVTTVRKGDKIADLVFVQNLAGNGELVGLVEEFEASFDFITSQGNSLYFSTTLDAPRGRIIRIDLEGPNRANWQTVLAEGDDAIESVKRAGDELAVGFLQDASHRLERFSLGGEHRASIPLPFPSTLTTVNGNEDDSDLFYGVTSFLAPQVVYHLDLKTGTTRELSRPEVQFDPSAYMVRQDFATSKDGTRVPIFLVHRKDLVPDNSNPTLLHAYGGFNVSLTPSFAVTRLPWLEVGGVLAVANLRGGGEYGEEWHLAGTKLRKQNVFDDFIACAEHLIASGVTRPEKLAIQGGSNGGLLVGAAMTQRPHLFGCALPAVGVMDMLKFHTFTIGWAWVADYGSSASEEEFHAIHAYSPLHNLREGTSYPPTLVTTADHDDRVVPAHSFKFTAQLQHVHAGEAPVLIRIQTQAGHGQGKPTRFIIEEAADVLAFTCRALGVEVPPS